MSQHNTPGIESSPAGRPTRALPGYDAARTGVALLDRRDHGRIVVSGADRAAYLQGMLTNDVSALKAGQGCYACYLTAQGRMISDLWVFELGDVMLITLPGATCETVLTRLDQYVFSEDVQLGNVTDTFSSLALLGPGSSVALSTVVERVSAEQIAALEEGGNLRATVDGHPAIVLRVADAGVVAYELLVGADQFGTCWQALRAAGADELSLAAAEVLRVEAGIPRFHQDMNEETIPLEAGLEARAISQTKGCYVGQEVIIRVLHRGHGRVAKKLVGLKMSSAADVPVARPTGPTELGRGGEVASPGGVIRVGDREIGRATSAVRSPHCQAPIALGYVQRDFVAPGTEVTVDGVPAIVSTLPFAS